MQRGGHHAGHQLLLLRAVAEERLDGAAFKPTPKAGRRQLAARVSRHAGELPRGPGSGHCRHHPAGQRILLQKLNETTPL